MDDDVDAIKVLKNLTRKLPKAVLIFGLNSKESMNRISGFFRKAEPAHLELPALSITELAEIMKRTLEQRGYRFSGGLNTQMLVDVINEQWSDAEVAGRNGHLTNIMVERVLHNKHQRQPVSYGFAADPSVLIPADFGITELSKVELAKMAEEVMIELEAMP